MPSRTWGSSSDATAALATFSLSNTVTRAHTATVLARIPRTARIPSTPTATDRRREGRDAAADVAEGDGDVGDPVLVTAPASQSWPSIPSPDAGDASRSRSAPGCSPWPDPDRAGTGDQHGNAHRVEVQHPRRRRGRRDQA